MLIRGLTCRHLTRQFQALRLHVDAKQTWRRDRQKPDDESRAHQVADRIGHRDVVLQPRLLGLWQLEPVDRIAGGADHCRFGERTGHQAGRGPAVVAHQLRRHQRRHQARHAEDDRQYDLGKRVLPQAAKELRANLVAGGKQEQREEDRLDRGIDLDVELSDEHAGDERAHDVPEFEGPHSDPAEDESAASVRKITSSGWARRALSIAVVTKRPACRSCRWPSRTARGSRSQSCAAPGRCRRRRDRSGWRTRCAPTSPAPQSRCR